MLGELFEKIKSKVEKYLNLKVILSAIYFFYVVSSIADLTSTAVTGIEL